MFENKYSKILTIILAIVIIIVVGLLGFLTYDYIQKYTVTKDAADFVEDFQGNLDTDNENKNENEGLNNIDNNNTETTGNIIFETNEIPIDNSGTGSSNTGSSGKKNYKNFTAVGTMKIPAINLEYPILEEVSTKSLETALVALYPSGDTLNLPGNTVIVGHNFRNGTFFSNLKKLSNGAKIYVTDYRGKSITYEVYNKFEASASDTSFYTRDTNGAVELTLSTCTDSSNDYRTIILAREV